MLRAILRSALSVAVRLHENSFGKFFPPALIISLSAGLKTRLTLTFVPAVYFQNLWGRKAPGEAEERRDSIILKNKKKVTQEISIHCMILKQEGSGISS